MEDTYHPPKLIELVNEQDNSVGLTSSPITIVEYGDYDCPHCIFFADIIKHIIKEYAGRIRFVFRHFPLTTIHPNSRLAAQAAEAAANQGKFWQMHQILFDRRDHTRPALLKYAEELELDLEQFELDIESEEISKRIDEDFEQGLRSGVNGTPTIFINNKRYDGAWDRTSIIEFIEKPAGVKIELLTQRFTKLAVSGGILLFFFTLLGVIFANSSFSTYYFDILYTYVDIKFGSFAVIHLSLEHVINDGLMAIFFFMVGLEIKRELLSGELADRSKAILPIVAAVGGAAVPALIFVLININNPSGIFGFGIPMATDIAFLLVILTFIDSKVPNALRVFFSALAIVDDIFGILVISIFYTSQVHVNYLIGAVVILVILITMNRGRIYKKLPYILFGLLMWWFVLQSGVHATIAGVLLAMTIPARKAPDTQAMIAQCSNMMNDIGLPGRDVEDLRHSAVQTLESITQRIQSPLEAIEHDIQPWVTYAILPVFAVANAGIAFAGTSLASLANPVTIGIIVALVLGKPLGILGFSYIAIRLGWAELPSSISWKSMFSLSWLAGIGFTMSLFISNLAYSDHQIVDDAKIGILIASTLATLIGLILGYYLNDEIGGKHSTISTSH